MCKRILKNTLSLFIVITLIWACIPAVNAFAKEQEPVIVIAGSDFQAETSKIGSENVVDIFSAIKEDGHDHADGFLFAGDYDVDLEDQSDCLAVLKETVQTEYPSLDEDKMVFVQGNHDEASTAGLSKTGANDTDDYGVFVINEDDFPWYGGSESHTKALAEQLRTYLQSRADEKSEQPVFVVSHLPLHYSYRTINCGDGKYGKYLFDVLNEYGEKLNIIFLFGHNHSASFDDYLGGSAIYLAKGDKIYVSKTGKHTETPDEYVLNFTYMNAGYVGYTWCLGNLLTMTVFEIKGEVVTVKRYTADGICPLKLEGDWSSKYEDSSATYGTSASYLKTYYASPQYICDFAEDGDVSIFAGGITSLNVTKSEAETVEQLQTVYASYDITAEGVEDGETAVVTIDLGRFFLDARPTFLRDKKTGEVTCLYSENNIVTFETDHLSSYELTQHVSETVFKTEITVYKAATELADGKSYIITTDIAEGKTLALGHKDTVVPVEAEIHKGFGSTYLISDDTAIQWLFQRNTSFGYAEKVGTLKNAATGEYLCSLDGETLSTVIEPVSAYGVWRVSSSAYGMYTPVSPDEDTRNYIKYHSDYLISESLESSARVYVFEKTQQQLTVNAYIDTAYGKVDVGADGSASTGIKLYLVGNDGTKQVEDVTVDMLRTADGGQVDTSLQGVLKDLTVYYGENKVYTHSALFVGEEISLPLPEDESVEESVAESVVPEESGEISISETEKDGGYTVYIIAGVIGLIVVIGIAAVVIKKKK